MKTQTKSVYIGPVIIRNTFFFLFLFLFILTVSFKAQAKKTAIVADADIVEKNISEETIILKGHVNVIFKQQHLLCDEAIIDEKNNNIFATGNVILQNARTTLRGDRLELNYETNKGKLYKGVITSGRILFQADLIEKVGEDEYVANNAYYTACLTCPASWGFTSSSIRAKIGDYAAIRKPWLYLLELPILPLPYLIVPLNTRRRTGFLVPKVSSNADNGLTLEQPFYWAINRSNDVTFSVINYEKRGLQAFGNYRYVLSPTSSGELNAAFLRDRSASHRKRWFTEYKHFWDLPKNYTQRAEVALVTDQSFVIDFPKQLSYSGYPALNNSLSLTKAMENSLLTVDTSYYVSLIEPEIDLLDQNYGLHRMPEINFNMTDQKISEKLNLFSHLKFQYLNITRYRGRPFEKTRRGEDQCVKVNKNEQDICYVDATKNDKFIYGNTYGENSTDDSDRDYGDLIRTGQRFDLVSGFHSPFWLGSSLSIDPFLTMRLTQYSFGVNSDPSQAYDSSPSRFYTQLGFSTKTYFHRIFQWSKNTKIKHSIIPSIDLQYIPEVYQSNHHFFGTQKHLKYFREQQPIDDTDADWRGGGRGIQFDQNDRVIGQQIVNFSITNKIFSRSLLSGQNRNLNKNIYKKNFYFRLSQAFDLKEAINKKQAQPWQDMRAYTYFNTGSFSQSVQTSYFPYHRRFLWQTTTHYAFMPKNFVSLAYAKNYMINNEPPIDNRTKDELIFFGTSLDFKYFYLYGILEYDLTARRELGEDNFKRWRISTRFTPPGSCWFIKGDIENRLDTGIVNYSMSMQFAFGQ